MDAELERTIIHYYPQRTLVSPLSNDAVAWDYDPSYGTLKAIVAELKRIDPELRPGTRGRYDISEELILADELHLQLCYLGPYAAMNYGVEREPDEDQRELRRGVTEVLTRHGVTLLPTEALDDAVPWIQHGTSSPATVWSCLFVLPEP